MKKLLYILAIMTLFLYLFPAVDIYISSLFFKAGEGFFLKNTFLLMLFYNSVALSVIIVTTFIIVGYIYQIATKKEFKNFNKKALMYLFLVFSIGSGVVVNAILKDNFGRARPVNIQEFGGNKEFSKTLIYNSKYSGKCKSFSCGHCSFALGFIAFYFLFRKRWILVLSLSYGLLVSLGRVSQGGHFFSDFVFSFFVMLLTAKLIYYYMYEKHKDRDSMVLGE